jgi:hypothetical protein
MSRCHLQNLGGKPADATHRSSPYHMAHDTGMSQSIILRIWHALGLQLWRGESFKSSTDRLFIDKPYDICGLYFVERAVVSVSMRSPRSRPWIGPSPSSRLCTAPPERRSRDYVRHGVTGLFAALDMATGKQSAPCTAVTGPSS